VYRTSAEVTFRLLLQVGGTVRTARRAIGWTQARLGREVGLAQSVISLIERGRSPELSVATAVRVLTALDVAIDVRLFAALVANPRSARDGAHARCVTYVGRCLEREGWLVAREVAVGEGRWKGFVDILAYHPVEHVVLVIEIKTEIRDLGALERQLGFYEREAWAAARLLGWRPRAVTGIALCLDTDDCAAILRDHRSTFDAGFRLRTPELETLIAAPVHPPHRGERGVAMIDPRSRARRWLRPTVLDGRRTSPRYSDRSSFARARRRAA